MPWNTLQTKIQNMGFELALRHRREDGGGYIPDLTPPEGDGWLYVGNYDNVAGIWIKPVTDNSRQLDADLVRKLIAALDPFIGTVGEIEAEDSDAFASVAAPVQSMERSGRRRVPVNERRRAPNGERRCTSGIDQLAPGMIERRGQPATAWSRQPVGETV